MTDTTIISRAEIRSREFGTESPCPFSLAIEHLPSQFVYHHRAHQCEPKHWDFLTGLGDSVVDAETETTIEREAL